MGEAPAAALPWGPGDLEGSVAERFERQADARPEAVAIRTRRESLTYAGLDARANGVAARALAARGDGSGPMAILAGDRASAIAALLGAFKAGKTALYLDAREPRERLEALLRDAGAGLVAGAGGALPAARALAGAVGAALVDVDAAGDGSPERPALRVGPDAPAQLTYTSGSTGRPRGVVTSHRHVLWSCFSAEGPARLGPADRVLLAASPGAGQALGIFLALLDGAAVVPVDIEEEGLPALRDRLAEDGITVYHSVPAVFRALVRTFRGGESFPRVRLVRLGGDRVRRDDVELFRSVFRPPCLLRVGYGCTEAGPIAGHLISADGPLPDGPIPVGRPYAGIDLRLLGEDGREAGPGEAGEIAVRSRYLALGYWRDEARTRESFLPDPAGGPERTYRTGDFGELRPDGLLVHRGRMDEQLKIRGNRVEAGEVEEALRALPGVEEAAVGAAPGTGGESRLVAWVAFRGSPAAPRALRAALARTLPDHMVPAAFVALPEIPRTARGKVDRAALAELAPPPAPETGATAPPGDGLERELTAVWERLLGRRVGPSDDFFDLGGDSLLAVELFATLESRLGLSLPLSRFAGATTVELLARRLREARPERWPCLVPLQERGARPPFYCASWAEGEVLAYAPLAARLAPGRPVYGLRRDRLPDGRPRHTRVEAMAAQYVEEVAAFQPAGPVHLGGLSGGALVALEMAHQLRAEGRAVGALVLMEPPRLLHGGRVAEESARARSPLRTLATKARLYPEKWRLLEPDEKRAELRRKAERLRLRLAGRARPAPAPVGADVAPDALLKDVEPYAPRPWPGRAALLLASHEPFRSERVAYWRSMVAGELEVRVVPGLHATIIQEPFVKALARELEACLAAR